MDQEITDTTLLAWKGPHIYVNKLKYEICPIYYVDDKMEIGQPINEIALTGNVPRLCKSLISCVLLIPRNELVCGNALLWPTAPSGGVLRSASLWPAGT